MSVRAFLTDAAGLPLAISRGDIVYQAAYFICDLEVELPSDPSCREGDRAFSLDSETFWTFCNGTWDSIIGSPIAWADVLNKPTTFAPIIGGAGNQAVAGNDARLTDARTPLAHATSHKSGGSDAVKLDELAAPTDNTTLNASTSAHGLMPKGTGSTSTFFRSDMTQASPTAEAAVIFTAFTKDLGVARRSGSFDITGLTGLTTGKPVQLFQTAAAIASKGNAADELEMDAIRLTGIVLNATTIRAYWEAPSVVVGTYAFAYLIGA